MCCPGSAGHAVYVEALAIDPDNYDGHEEESLEDPPLRFTHFDPEVRLCSFNAPKSKVRLCSRLARHGWTQTVPGLTIIIYCFVLFSTALRG